MPDVALKEAHATIYKSHREEVNDATTRARDSKTLPDPPLSGLLRKRDFRSMLRMDPPYDNHAGFNPVDVHNYFRSQLSDVIDLGYRLYLVSDCAADELQSDHHIGSYETIATVGKRLAIRRTTCFEIAWSFNAEVIRKFNSILDELIRDKKRTIVLGRSEIDRCCDLISVTLRRCASLGGVMQDWHNLDFRNLWQTELEKVIRERSIDFGFLQD
jgi:hypothetical protein